MIEPGLMQPLTWIEWAMCAGVILLIIAAFIVIIETIKIFWRM